jgi:hypothetical protein
VAWLIAAGFLLGGACLSVGVWLEYRQQRGGDGLG